MNIVVLCGGLSMERNVSIKSGEKIAEVLRKRGHRVVIVDAFFGYIGEYHDPADIFLRDDAVPDQDIPEDVPDLEELRIRRGQGNESRIGDNLMEVCRAADIVFIAMHGSDGEDGRLQAAFDIAGVKYTGCGYLGSALAMNKAASKDVFRGKGILTPQEKVIAVSSSDKSYPCLPCVVKPKSNGSSVGTSIAHTPEEFESALEFAFTYEDEVLAERYIKGREVDVAVIDGTALPPVEICPRSGFFDYKNKYQDGMTDEYCPADLPDDLTEKLMRTAENVFRALYLEIYARIDFIIEESTGDIYCLEANTLPGMTPASLMPKEARAAGIEYGDLCEKIIALSLERFK